MLRSRLQTVFDHFDQCAGNPHLHTPVAISGEVLGVDGRWCTLGLYRMTVAASELYSTRFETQMIARRAIRRGTF